MKNRRLFPIYSIVCLGIFTASLIISFLISQNAFLADKFNRTTGFAIRFLLAKAAEIFPFSIGELLLLASPILLFLVCLIVYKCARISKRELVRCLSCLLATASLVYSLFVLDFSAGYKGYTLKEKMNLTECEVDAEALKETLEKIVYEINTLSADLPYSYKESTSMPYSLHDLSEELCRAYGKVCDEYGFIDNYDTHVKPLMISKYMTYTHISGIYSFFTGEANLNTNFPDYVKVYTAAHEMAHQRGISREDEANFIAFLVCSESESDYTKYCAYLNIFEYCANALYSASPEMYFEVYNSLAEIAKNELSAYSEFFEKYRHNAAADITDQANDSYLKDQGTPGVVSYGMVAELCVYYFNR